MRFFAPFALLFAASCLLSACETDPVPTTGSASVETPFKAVPRPPAAFRNFRK